MINIIWFLLLLLGISTAALRGEIHVVTQATMQGAEQGVTVAFGLIGIIAFWSGMMRVAEDAGLMQALAKLMRPIAKLLFPDIPNDHPAMSAVLVSMSANLLGLGNACTPLGLKAMEELQTLNHSDEQATDSMCTFIALTTSSLTLVPSTVIAFRFAQGSLDPTEIIGTTVIATFVSTIVALTADRLLRKFSH